MIKSIIKSTTDLLHIPFLLHLFLKILLSPCSFILNKVASACLKCFKKIFCKNGFAGGLIKIAMLCFVFLIHFSPHSAFAYLINQSDYPANQKFCGIQYYFGFSSQYSQGGVIFYRNIDGLEIKKTATANYQTQTVNFFISPINSSVQLTCTKGLKVPGPGNDGTNPQSYQIFRCGANGITISTFLSGSSYVANTDGAFGDYILDTGTKAFNLCKQTCKYDPSWNWDLYGSGSYWGGELYPETITTAYCKPGYATDGEDRLNSFRVYCTGSTATSDYSLPSMAPSWKLLPNTVQKYNSSNQAYDAQVTPSSPVCSKQVSCILNDNNYSPTSTTLYKNITATINCKPNAQTLDGNTSFVASCSEDSSGNGLLSGVKTCYSGCTLTNNNYSPSTTAFIHNQTKAITCKAGYYTSNLNTSFSATCNNGTLSNQIECQPGCSINKNYYSPNINIAVEGDEKTINCANGYRTDSLETSFATQCTNQQFSLTNDCKASCSYSNSLMQESPINLLHLETQQVNCAEGYVINNTTSSFTLSCNNGNISGVKQCKRSCNMSQIIDKLGDAKYTITKNNIDFKNSPFAIEDDRIIISCFSDSGTVYDSYSPTCKADGMFSEARACSSTNLQCLQEDGVTVGKSIKILASQTASSTLNSGESIQVDCNQGYFSSVLGSSSNNFMLSCNNGEFNNKTSCIKKCSPIDLQYLGDISLRPLFFTAKQTLEMSDILEPGKALSVSCNPKNGYSYANIDTKRQQAQETVKYSCNTSGFFRPETSVSPCKRIDCPNSEISIEGPANTALPPEFLDGITKNLKTIECPIGFTASIGEGETKYPFCGNGEWINASSVKCTITPPIAKPVNKSPILDINCVVGATAFQNASINDISLNANKFGVIKNGAIKTVKCDSSNNENGSKFLLNTDFSAANLNSFDITCNHGKLLESIAGGAITQDIQKQCVPKCDANTLSGNSIIRQYGGQIIRRYFNPNEKLTITCNANYGVDGKISFDSICNLSGEFSDLRKCALNYTSCNNYDLLPFVDQTRVDKNSIANGKTEPGNYLTPSCLPEYSAPTSALCVNGKWGVSNAYNLPITTNYGSQFGSNTSVASSGAKLTCMKNCNYNNLQQVYVLQQSPANNIFKHGEIIRRSCLPNTTENRFFNDLNFSTCNNGSWTNNLSCVLRFPFSKTNLHPDGRVDDSLYYRLFTDYPYYTIEGGFSEDLISGPKTYKLRCSGGQLPAWVVEKKTETTVALFFKKTTCVNRKAFIQNQQFTVGKTGSVVVPYINPDNGMINVVSFSTNTTAAVFDSIIPGLGSIYNFISCIGFCSSDSYQDMGLICTNPGNDGSWDC